MGVIEGVVLNTEIFFFFQAEDGIRDLTVTGVQTCALPICRRPGLPREHRLARGRAGRRRTLRARLAAHGAAARARRLRPDHPRAVPAAHPGALTAGVIRSGSSRCHRGPPAAPRRTSLLPALTPPARSSRPPR